MPSKPLSGAPVVVGTSEAVIAIRSVPPACAVVMRESSAAAVAPRNQSPASFRCDMIGLPACATSLTPYFSESVANDGPTGKLTPEGRLLLGCRGNFPDSASWGSGARYPY